MPKTIEVDLNTALIAKCVELTDTLLKAHWTEIQTAREETDGMIAISFQHRIEYKGDEKTVKTRIAFGVRKSDSREAIVDTDQTEFDLDPDREAKPRRGRPKKMTTESVVAAEREVDAADNGDMPDFQGGMRAR